MNNNIKTLTMIFGLALVVHAFAGYEYIEPGDKGYSMHLQSVKSMDIDIENKCDLPVILNISKHQGNSKSAPARHGQISPGRQTGLVITADGLTIEETGAKQKKCVVPVSAETVTFTQSSKDGDCSCHVK